MEKNNQLTRGLALFGTMMMWLPLLMPLVFAMAALWGERRFLLDYLMPAELFPLSIIGFGLLLWAALRVHSHQKWIGWGFVTALVLLFLSQTVAVVTGLASGATEPTTFLITLILIPYAMYVLALIATSVGGALLTYDLFHSSKTSAI
jgi:hypothetical protein